MHVWVWEDGFIWARGSDFTLKNYSPFLLFSSASSSSSLPPSSTTTLCRSFSILAP